MRTNTPFLVLALPAILATASGCARGPEETRDGSLRVVATTGMIAEAAARIAGDRAVVTGLMGPGVDPHLFKASEGDVSRMAEADLVLYNGLHLEGKMVDLFERMAARGDRTVAVADAIPEDSLLRSEQFSGSHDPHVWFDPALWRLAVLRVAEALTAADPASAEAFAGRRDAYLAEMDSADAYVRRTIARIAPRDRVVVTSHDAFGYFGRAYGFEVRGLQGLSTAAEAGTADVQDLAEFVAERRIPALFLETSVSSRGMEAVLAAVRSRGHDVRLGGTLFGDALGSPGTPASTYPGMLRSNAETLAEALARE